MARKTTNPPENANRILAAAKKRVNRPDAGRIRAAATEAVNRNIARAKDQRIQQKFTKAGAGGNAKGPSRRQSARIERAGLASPLARKGGRLVQSKNKSRQAGGSGG